MDLRKLGVVVHGMSFSSVASPLYYYGTRYYE